MHTSSGSVVGLTVACSAVAFVFCVLGDATRLRTTTVRRHVSEVEESLVGVLWALIVVGGNFFFFSVLDGQGLISALSFGVTRNVGSVFGTGGVEVEDRKDKNKSAVKAAGTTLGGETGGWEYHATMFVRCLCVFYPCDVPLLACCCNY